MTYIALGIALFFICLIVIKVLNKFISAFLLRMIIVFAIGFYLVFIHRLPWSDLEKTICIAIIAAMFLTEYPEMDYFESSDENKKYNSRVTSEEDDGIFSGVLGTVFGVWIIRSIFMHHDHHNDSLDYYDDSDSDVDVDSGTDIDTDVDVDDF